MSTANEKNNPLVPANNISPTKRSLMVKEDEIMKKLMVILLCTAGFILPVSHARIGVEPVLREIQPGIDYVPGENLLNTILPVEKQ